MRTWFHHLRRSALEGVVAGVAAVAARVLWGDAEAFGFEVGVGISVAVVVTLGVAIGRTLWDEFGGETG